jgi:hypothetical protein
LPKRGGLDQRLQNRFIDLPQAHDAHPGAKRIEDANIGGQMSMAQPGKVPPRPLLR